MNVHRFLLEINGNGLQVKSEEHTSELQSRPHISYAVFCLKKKKKTNRQHTGTEQSSR